jgi:hypothetical protein
MNRIEVVNDAGKMWVYEALSGPETSPADTGWVCYIEGQGEKTEPQAVTPADVVGGLEEMVVGEPTTREAVEALTEGMIRNLERRAEELGGGEEDAAPFRARASELRVELNDALEVRTRQQT